ncbi:MAG: hypothetical protein KF799_09580 [Bdellovibrionales bacterium]|nr:hypothetical protein [Bdellovibrionales bacterium]
MKCTVFAILLALAFTGTTGHAQIKGVPKLPTSSNLGLQGSAGAGFTDFAIGAPKDDLRLDRGIYVAGAIERGFNVMNLYLTLSLSYMTAEGVSNYRYTNLSSTTTYTATDVKFTSSVADLGLGLKLKLIDNYWFRPYIEGGGLGGYHQINYTSKQAELAAQGTNYKSKDVVMGSGFYGEVGIEAMFSDKFGVKLAGRQSSYQTKAMETFDNRPLRYLAETYYFSMLFGM